MHTVRAVFIVSISAARAGNSECKRVKEGDSVWTALTAASEPRVVIKDVFTSNHRHLYHISRRQTSSYGTPTQIDTHRVRTQRPRPLKAAYRTKVVKSTKSKLEESGRKTTTATRPLHDKGKGQTTISRTPTRSLPQPASHPSRTRAPCCSVMGLGHRQRWPVWHWPI